MEKKVFKVLIMITLLVMAVTTVVQANTFTASMTPSSTTVPPATEFTVTVKISNLDVGSNGINTLSGFLKYDDDVFEVINESHIDGLNEWKPTFTSENGKITLIKTVFVKTDEDVFQIAFKTKSEEALKKNKTSGSITLSNIYGSNSQDDIKAGDISTTITIGTQAENEVTNNALVLNSNTVKNSTVKNVVVSNKTENNVGASKNTTNNTTANLTVVNKAVNSTVNTSTRNKTTFNTIEDEDIPYTGVEDTIVYVLFAAIALALVFYIKFEKINKDIR